MRLFPLSYRNKRLFLSGPRVASFVLPPSSRFISALSSFQRECVSLFNRRREVHSPFVTASGQLFPGAISDLVFSGGDSMGRAL